jgi:hypothetical protein
LRTVFDLLRCHPAVWVFAVALLPRLWGLDRFLAVDEWLWMTRAQRFLSGIERHDWAATFQTGHPGVTTMWLGSLGYWLYAWRHGLASPELQTLLAAAQRVHYPVDLWIDLHLPIVLAAAATLAAICWLLSYLWGRRAALLAGLLLAFDPWHLAHSRVLHHDALMAGFMTLSALSLLVYLWRIPARGLLLFSGLCAGLALLSKTLAFFLAPWAGLVFWVALLRRRTTWPQMMVDGIIWVLAGWLTAFLLWPALWLEPLATLHLMRVWAEMYAVNPHAQGQFFLGHAIADPGLFYYPVVAAFSLTPVVLAGLVALAAVALRRMYWRLSIHDAGRSGDSATLTTPLLLLAVYAIAYTVAISLGEKKQDRYLLPALMMGTVLASTGLAFWIDRLAVRVPARIFPARTAAPVLLLLLTAGQALSSLPHYPYYRTYANPLVGGARAEAWALKTGDGEGMELAAAYLNGLPDAADLTVVATQPDVFGQFFQGKTQAWQRPAEVFAADYAVLYRSNVQQGFPHAVLMRYVRQSWPLVHTVWLHGMDYAWVYQAPAARWTLSTEPREREIEELGLLAYDLELEQTAGQTHAIVTLYRRTDDAREQTWVVALQQPQGGRVVHAQPAAPSSPAGDIVAEIFEAELSPYAAWPDALVRVGVQDRNGSIAWLPLVESTRLSR